MVANGFARSLSTGREESALFWQMSCLSRSLPRHRAAQATTGAGARSGGGASLRRCRSRRRSGPAGPYSLAAVGAARRRPHAALPRRPAHVRLRGRRRARPRARVAVPERGAAGSSRRCGDPKRPSTRSASCSPARDDHTEFLRRFGSDPLIGRTTSRLRGLRPLRTATVTHALLRALCGQLISAREARRIEARLVARYAARARGAQPAPHPGRLRAAEPGGALRLGPRGPQGGRARADLARLGPRATALHADGGSGAPPRRGAHAGPVVGGGDLPLGPRSLRARAGRRSRSDQALPTAARSRGDPRGHGRAPRPLRRVAGARQRLPAGPRRVAAAAGPCAAPGQHVDGAVHASAREPPRRKTRRGRGFL